ncbi:hypothetical protein OYC64_011425 [Pagothenia borchgrevinki]|uniref:Uncharacterized protein n=1 Tax=Pagothenia borchgrevinki TaxID=8213 RepID=A0ABD2FFY4_PAGBO
MSRRTKSRCVRQIPTTLRSIWRKRRRGSDLKEVIVDQLTKKTCWREIWDSAPILLLSPEAAEFTSNPISALREMSMSGVI